MCADEAAASQLDNLALVFKLLEAANVKLESVKPRSILEGHEQSIMGLIWTLIKEFELKVRVRVCASVRMGHLSSPFVPRRGCCVTCPHPPPQGRARTPSWNG